jgi:predicted nucleic acid-binding protein
LILVDTSVWVDHLRSGNKVLASLLDAGTVLVHPFVIGELALGHLRQRAVILDALADLPQVSVATDTEVLHFIDRNALFGRGVGYVDVHLLASVRLTPGAMLWTSDRRLQVIAVQLDLAVPLNTAPPQK